jgi:pyridoxamine 5'-phosphate oxidase
MNRLALATRGGRPARALASRQSEPLGSRAELDERPEVESEAGEGLVLRPATWGGFLLAGGREFWQHRSSRLHDRFRYEREPSGEWRIERLSP